MRAKLAALSFSIFAAAAICVAPAAPQTAGPAQANYSAVYCSGFISANRIPDDSYLISGEQASTKIIFSRGDYVYINQGGEKGVQVGDRYMVMRPATDPLKVEWFKGQQKLIKAMGTLYVDSGHLRVVNVQPKVSIAEVVFACDHMQRGDIIRPFEERPQPPFKDISSFDHFAPVSGKPVGTVVGSKDFAQSNGQGNTVYVNLGASQGVKVGDYLRVFRHQGELTGTIRQTRDYQYKIYGFGGTPARYAPKDLPDEVLGEGIVINVSRNSATVFLTYSSNPIYTGDYVELE
jgi:hypothetical protein